MQLRTCGSLTVAQGTTRLSSPGPVLASCVLCCVPTFDIVVRTSGAVIKNHHVGRLFLSPLYPIQSSWHHGLDRPAIQILGISERQWFAML